MVDTLTQRSVFTIAPINLQLEGTSHANRITAARYLPSLIWIWRKSKEKTRTTTITPSPRPSTCLLLRSPVRPSTLAHLLRTHTLHRLPAPWLVAVEVALALLGSAKVLGIIFLHQSPVGRLETTKNIYLLLSGCRYHRYQKHSQATSNSSRYRYRPCYLRLLRSRNSHCYRKVLQAPSEGRI